MIEEVSAVILAAAESESLSPSERSFYKRYPVAGLTLFKRNIPQDYFQLKTLIEELQVHQPSMPMMVAIDQEGGRVSRMPAGFPNLGPALNIGRLDPESAGTLGILKEYGERLGAALRVVGVNVNFAPCTDILTKELNTAIGDRCFGRNARSVSLRAGAFLEGMQNANVIGCLKHFPGQGDAGTDTHLKSAYIHASRATLNQREMLPFQNLLKQAQLVMISHCIYSDLDAVPASLSAKIQKEILRGELGFEGLILSDDMNMSAISQKDDEWIDGLCDAILAGSDLLLICRDVSRIEMAITKMTERCQQSFTLKSRVLESARRVRAFRKTLLA